MKPIYGVHFLSNGPMDGAARKIKDTIMKSEPGVKIETRIPAILGEPGMEPVDRIIKRSTV